MTVTAGSSLTKAYFDALEQALRGMELCGEALVAAPRSHLDLRPAARSLEVAATRLLDAYDGRAEVGAALDEAAAACDGAERELARCAASDEGLAPAVEWAKKASGWLRAAFDGASRASLTVAASREIIASRDVTGVHAVGRATLSPSYSVVDPLPPVAAPEPPPDAALPVGERLALVRQRADERRASAVLRRATAAEKRERERLARKLDVDPPVPGFVPGRHRAISDSDLVRDRARECFEDIAAMGTMRLPLLGDPWRTSSTFDQRMLIAIDALAALGPRAISHLERFVVDAPAKDPSRAFAIAMTLGSIEGRDALAAMERSLRFLGVDVVETVQKAAEALSLVAHPELVALLRRWLVDPEPGMRALAVEVLARRGELTNEEIERALRDDDARVIERALIPAAMMKHPDLASRAEELANETNEGVTNALAWALVLGEVPFAMTRLGEWLGSAREESALLPIALAGELDDVRRLFEVANKRPKKPRLFALGWSGIGDAIPLLIRVLRDSKDDELHLTAAFALDRITGARLTDESFVPPENLDVPDPDEPDDPMTGLPLALDRRIGDPRDLPAEGSPDRMTLPTVDPARWEAWLAARSEPFAPERRYRRGRLYTPTVSLEEFDREPLVPHERRLLERELVLKTGQSLPLDSHSFLSVQEAQIAAWTEPAHRASSQPGVFGRARRR